MYKSEAIEKAIEVAKSAASAGNAAPQSIFENVYNKIEEVCGRIGEPLQ